LASVTPKTVTGNSFSLHLKVESMWNTTGTKHVLKVGTMDNKALEEKLIIHGCISVPSPKISLHGSNGNMSQNMTQNRKHVF
jgi:hypothetical protein